jgi:transposase
MEVNLFRGLNQKLSSTGRFSPPGFAEISATKSRWLSCAAVNTVLPTLKMEFSFAELNVNEVEELTMHKKRKNYTSQEQVSILKEHLIENSAVSDLCDKYGLHPTVFYRWQKEFFEKSIDVFDNLRDARSVKLERRVKSLEEKIARKISELMEEQVALKKALGRSEGTPIEHNGFFRRLK